MFTKTFILSVIAPLLGTCSSPGTDGGGDPQPPPKAPESNSDAEVDDKSFDPTRVSVAFRSLSLDARGRLPNADERNAIPADEESLAKLLKSWIPPESKLTPTLQSAEHCRHELDPKQHVFSEELLKRTGALPEALQKESEKNPSCASCHLPIKLIGNPLAWAQDPAAKWCVVETQFEKLFELQLLTDDAAMLEIEKTHKWIARLRSRRVAKIASIEAETRDHPDRLLPSLLQNFYLEYFMDINSNRTFVLDRKRYLKRHHWLQIAKQFGGDAAYLRLSKIPSSLSSQPPTSSYWNEAESFAEELSQILSSSTDLASSAPEELSTKIKDLWTKYTGESPKIDDEPVVSLQNLFQQSGGNQNLSEATAAVLKAIFLSYQFLQY